MASLVLWLFSLLLLTSSFGLAAQSVKRPMSLDDLARFVRVGAPEVSPDGKWIAYSVSHVDTAEDKNVSDLWMVNWEGTEDVQLTFNQAVAEGASAGSPRWSPDGRYLAFTSDRPGPAKGTQVWMLDRRGGEARQVTDIKQTLGQYRWSPDSRSLLLTLREKEEPEPDKGAKPKPPKPIVLDRYHFKQDIEGYLSDKRDHLFLFDIATRKLQKLTDSSAEEREAEWSPDGRHIAFISNVDQPDPDRTANDDVFVTDAQPNSKPRKLTTFTGRDTGPLAWSPDSLLIAYRQSLAPHYTAYEFEHLAVVRADGGSAPETKGSADTVGPPLFNGDARTLLTTVTDDRNQYVAEVDAGSGMLHRLTAGQGAANSLSTAAGHTALLWTTDSAAPELYALDSGRLRKLTSHNDALLSELDLAVTDDLTAKSKDGTEIHGLLTLPCHYRPGSKIPLLLFIHGGPTAQDEHRFAIDRQLFAAHGYAVLNVNYRGSSGRGLAFGTVISADWGDKEVSDLLASVDAAVATGKIDPDKLLIGGWSYGGILTDYTIASTNRFKAASSGAGTANLFGMYGIDQYILQYDNELGPPWKNPQAYIKLSYPFFHADRIKTPTLFMGGEKDFNVSLAGGEQMYQALKSVGTPAELVVYPGQFHGFTRPSFIRDRYQRWFDWYDRYLPR